MFFHKATKTIDNVKAEIQAKIQDSSDSSDEQAIIDAAYSAVKQLIVLVPPGESKTTALNELRELLDMPETTFFDYRALLVNDMTETLLWDSRKL